MVSTGTHRCLGSDTFNVACNHKDNDKGIDTGSDKGNPKKETITKNRRTQRATSFSQVLLLFDAGTANTNVPGLHWNSACIALNNHCVNACHAM